MTTTTAPITGIGAPMDAALTSAPQNAPREPPSPHLLDKQELGEPAATASATAVGQRREPPLACERPGRQTATMIHNPATRAG